jgi:hypothetical protein
MVAGPRVGCFAFERSRRSNYGGRRTPFGRSQGERLNSHPPDPSPTHRSDLPREPFERRCLESRALLEEVVEGKELGDPAVISRTSGEDRSVEIGEGADARFDVSEQARDAILELHRVTVLAAEPEGAGDVLFRATTLNSQVAVLPSKCNPTAELTGFGNRRSPLAEPVVSPSLGRAAGDEAPSDRCQPPEAEIDPSLEHCGRRMDRIRSSRPPCLLFFGFALLHIEHGDVALRKKAHHKFVTLARAQVDVSGFIGPLNFGGGGSNASKKRCRHGKKQPRPQDLPPRLAAGQRFVEIVRPRSRKRRDHRGRGSRPRSRLDEVAQGVDGEADVLVMVAGGGGGDD